MASVIVTMKIMPEEPSTDLQKVESEATKFITEFGGKVGKTDIVPVAFGLKSVNLMFVMDESKGSTDSLESQISGIEGVNSAEVTDVRRAIG